MTEDKKKRQKITEEDAVVNQCGRPMRHFTKLKEDGNLEAEGRPKLSRPAAIDIVRVLLHRIGPGDNENQYTGMATSIC